MFKSFDNAMQMQFLSIESYDINLKSEIDVQKSVWLTTFELSVGRHGTRLNDR